MDIYICDIYFYSSKHDMFYYRKSDTQTLYQELMDPSVLFSQEVILPSSARELFIYAQRKEAKRKKFSLYVGINLFLQQSCWNSSAAISLPGEQIGSAVTEVNRWCQ